MADEHDEDGEILLGCWDCTSCGAKRLRGDAYQCRFCAAPRPDDVTFYLPTDAEVIQDARAIQAAEAGPDWQCAFCDSWMPATDRVCLNCQASVEASQRQQTTRTYSAGEVPPIRRPPVGAAAAERPIDVQRIADPGPSRRGSPRRRLSRPALIVIALLAVAAVFYGVNLTRRQRAYKQRVDAQQLHVALAQQQFDEAAAKQSKASDRLSQAQRAVARAKAAVTTARNTVDELQRTQQAVEDAMAVEVKAHHWTVALQIEQCTAKAGEGWKHPPEAIDVRSEQRVHHHEKVLDRVETLFRTETYRAQDGFDTETYTERVSAGTRRVPDGHDVEDLGNGRFRRTPKYRTEQIYENVTRTRRKPRMVTKTRQIPYENKVYRQDPVRQPWYIYRTKVWTAAPAMSRSGQGLEVLEPEGRPPEEPGNELGAKRVRQRSVTYSLTLQPTAAESPSRNVVLAEPRWRSFAAGTNLLVAQNEVLTEQEQRDKLASLSEKVVQMKQQVEQLAAKVAPLATRVEPLREAVAVWNDPLAHAQAELAQANQRLEAVVAAGY